MTLTRRDNVDVHLAVWADTVLGRPFTWGTTDCASLVHRALVVMYGRGVASRLPKRWSSKAAGLRLAKATTAEVCLEVLGALEVPAVFARTGDIMVTPAAEGHPAGMGVVVAAALVTSTPAGGVHAYPVPRTVNVFRVPHVVT